MPIQHPSRQLAFSLRLYLLFGKFLTQFGFLWLGLALITTWVLLPDCEVVADMAYRAPLATTTATVTSVAPPAAGGDFVKNYRVAFRFTPPGAAAPVEGASYIDALTLRAGETATVEYRPDRPTVARIQGTASAPVGLVWFLFALALPAIGLALLLPGVLTGLFRIRMLASGHAVQGTLQSMASTPVVLNDRPVMKAVFTFTTPDGQEHTTTVRTNDPREEWLDYLQYLNRADESPAEMEAPTETLLYDPARPSRTLAPCSISYDLYLDGYGDVHGIAPAPGYAAIILPLLVLLGHGGYLISILAR